MPAPPLRQGRLQAVLRTQKSRRRYSLGDAPMWYSVVKIWG